VRDHLAHCAQCRQYYDEIARLSAQFQKWAGTEPSVEVRPAFHARWMRSIQTADAPARTSTLISRWTDLLWPSPAAWGALAAVGFVSFPSNGPHRPGNPPAKCTPKHLPAAQKSPSHNGNASCHRCWKALRHHPLPQHLTPLARAANGALSPPPFR
jgi:hypothetical protein